MKGGYKTTPLGIIPKDWNVQILKDISEKIWIGLVTTMTTSYVEAGVPLIRNSDIKENRILKDRLIHLEKSFAEKNIGRCVRVGDIVTVHTGDIGTSAIIDAELDGAQGFATLNTRLSDDVHNKYVCNFFNSPLFKRQAYSFSTGDGRNNLNLKDFVKSFVAFPTSLAEQQKIAEILSTVDKKIEIVGEQISQTQELRRGLMKRLLTKGIGHSRFKDSPLGEIPESWEVVKLSEVVEVNPTKPQDIPEDELISFVGMADVSEEAKLTVHHKKTYKEVSQGFTSFQDGDVLVAKITPCFENGKGALVNGLIGGLGFGSTEFHVLRAQSRVLNTFLYYHTVSYPFREMGKANMTGSAGQKRVGKGFIQTYFVPLPSPPEQQEIANILSTVDEKLEVLQGKKQQYQELKKGLMQQLLTGKVRVTNLLTNAVPA